MPKLKTCKNKECKKKFTHKNGLIGWCSPSCGYAYSQQLKEKKEKLKKKQINKEKKDFNDSDKTTLKKLAQSLINKYARLRDTKERGLKCCTCDHKDSGQFDGGHFLPTSGYSAIRYNTNQIHLQCKRCNRFNGGMPKEYRLFMINKYGLEYVENLEATKNVLRSYSVEYYQRLIKIVRLKTKRLGK